VGDGAVGKTFLLTALLDDPQSDPIDWDNPTYVPTAAKNNSVEWEYSDPEGAVQDFNLEVWDTAGQEALKSLRLMAYPDTDIFMIGYDMTREVTLENIVGCELTKLNTFSLEDEDSDDDDDKTTEVSSWMREITQGCKSDFKVILIGTKADFWEEKMAKGDSKGMTTWQQGYDVARAIGAAAYIQTSAKTMQGISEAVDDGIGGPADKQVDPEGIWLKKKILEIRYKQINNQELPTVEKVAPAVAGGAPAKPIAPPAKPVVPASKEPAHSNNQTVAAKDPAAPAKTAAPAKPADAKPSDSGNTGGGKGDGKDGGCCTLL
jgi:GTPase SAR1 family protein